jgi:hypothetical protein
VLRFRPMPHYNFPTAEEYLEARKVTA